MNDIAATPNAIPQTMTPREIVQELDKHIVGQAAAKRAVAIALRNRWRRMQVAEPMRAEIHPKNILMIGPTGVGKTEIARRLAKLATEERILDVLLPPPKYFGEPSPQRQSESNASRQVFRKQLREGKLDDKE